MDTSVVARWLLTVPRSLFFVFALLGGGEDSSFLVHVPMYMGCGKGIVALSIYSGRLAFFPSGAPELVLQAWLTELSECAQQSHAEPPLAAPEYPTLHTGRRVW